MTTEELYLKLEDPEYFRENLVDAHSDHFFYENINDILKMENMPLKQSLNGEWLFKYSNNLSERPEDFYKPGFSYDGFDRITVPGNIETQGYGIRQYVNDEYPWAAAEPLKSGEVSREDSPVGSYVTKFILNKDLKGHRVFICFAGVQSAYRLFVNGEYVCYSEDSFTPSESEITGYLKDGDNTVCVEVYKNCSGTWLECQDMWRFFGIFREVYLYAIPSAHVWDIQTECDYDHETREGSFKALARIEGDAGYALADVIDKNGKAVLSLESRVLNKDGSKYTCFQGKIPNVRPWSAEIPDLYTLRVVLIASTGNPVEYSITKIGFKRVTIEDGVLKINGKRIVLNGVNRHEFDALTGRALSLEDMLRDIKNFKKNNINAVRTCHYPNQSIWYRLCDEYGIYMIDETNIETHGSWSYSGDGPYHHPLPGSDPKWTGAALDRANNMLRRDINHAAVIMWSLGNESFGGENFIKMHDHFKNVDPTRPVHYEGVCHDPSSSDATDIESMMYAHPEFIREHLSSHQPKPFVLCEYMHSMGNSTGGLKLYTDLVDEFEQYAGGFIWDYIDQAVYRDGKDSPLCYGGDFKDRPNDGAFSGDGIVFADRTDSPKIAEVKQLYAPVRLYPEAGGVSVENRFLFKDLSSYYVVFTIDTDEDRIYRKVYDDINCPPGEKIYLMSGFEGELSKESDHVIKAVICQKESTRWAEAGYEVSFGEKCIFADANPVALFDTEKTGFKHVADSSKAKGVDTGSLKAEFGIYSNGPRKFNLSGKEYFEKAPVPVFFRAFTDNDLGCGFNKKTALWHASTLYQTCKFADFDVRDNVATAIYDFNSVMDLRIWVRVTYRVYASGVMSVTLKYRGIGGLPEIPLIGLEFKLDKSLEYVKYFGKGPDENYCDRNNGTATGIYKTKVSDNLTSYLRPQECGNRTNVRWIELTDEEDEGLLFAVDKGVIEASFLPCSAYELENAGHAYELPDRNYTWLRLLIANTGVGGDDSWGSPVHPEFKPDPSKDYEMTIVIKKI